jgi:hypothetical protein
VYTAASKLSFKSRITAGLFLREGKITPKCSRDLIYDTIQPWMQRYSASELGFAIPFLAFLFLRLMPTPVS